ncbi:MAG: EFR1 family ferrodoxin [Candidatus Hermodarchaeota archaeon]
MKIPIVYFSSSGNTKYVAQLIKNGLKYVKFESELIPLKSLKVNKLNLKEIEVLGIGAPIYAMTFTLNMLEWIKKIPIAKKKVRFFLFDTNAGLPGSSIKQVRRILERKNYNFIGALEVIVPTRDSVFESKYFKYVKWSRKKIDKIFQFGVRLGKIIQTETDILDWSNPTLFGSIIRAYFQKLENIFYKYGSKLISYNPNKCKECKVCEMGCPTQALLFNKNPVINHKKCILCFRCVRNCPENALFFKILPKVKYFKGPKTIKGYIPPDEILKEYSQLKAFSNNKTPNRLSS